LYNEIILFMQDLVLSHFIFFVVYKLLNWV